MKPHQVLKQDHNVIKEDILLCFGLELQILLEFDSIMILHMQVNVIVLKWHTPTFYISHDLSLCSNILFTTKHNTKAILHLVRDQSGNTTRDNI